MVTTKRAEELAKELSERLEGLCEGLAISGDSPSKETILNYFNELNNYRQSEIDELTKEVERLRNLNKRLFTLWENLYEAGEISISKNFSTSFNEIRESINNLKK